MKTNRFLMNLFNLFIALVILVWTLLPLAWIVLSSLKTIEAQFHQPPLWFGFKITLENYQNFFSNSTFVKSFINSTIVTSGSVILSLLLGTPTAYALARFRFRQKSKILIFVLLSRMTPQIVLVVPFFFIARKLGISDTYLALIGMGSFLAIPFVIWMMRGFFAEIPVELEEAAMVDGCSRFNTIRCILLPLVAPGFAATAILCSLLVWNEFLFALILSGSNTRTLPVLVNMFVSEKCIDWGTMSAAGVVTVLPLIVFGLLAQKHLVRGLTMGSIK